MIADPDGNTILIDQSRGIRVPKLLLEQADLPEKVELHAPASWSLPTN